MVQRRVMISSTARDLPVHREQVRLACERAGFTPHDMMEHLTALSADAIKVSLKMVEDADVYIGIFAYRYGYVPDGHNISITEMEYNRAVELNRPRLIFFIHEDHVVTGKDFETGPGVTKLQALKERIANTRVVAFFKSPEDLRAHVVEALSNLGRELDEALASSAAKAAAEPRRKTSAPTPPQSMAREVSQTSAKDHVVILVHGIRDFALWQDTVRSALEESGFTVEATNYGRFNLVEFLLPIGYFRRQAVETVWRQIRIVKRNNPNAYISVVAHSFGTFVIAHLMKENFDIEFYRIVFCGSVVPYGFEFEQIQDRFAPPIINEVGTRDIWPAMAESITLGYGSAGTYGFRRPLVRDRWHNEARHGYFLNRSFCHKYWIPFLENGQVVPGAAAPERPRAWLQALSVFKIKYLLAATAMSFAALLFYADRIGPVPETKSDTSVPKAIQKRTTAAIPPGRLLSAAPFRVRLDDCTKTTCDVELFLRGYDSKGRLRFDSRQRFERWINGQFRDTVFNTTDTMYFEAGEEVRFRIYCRSGQESVNLGETSELDWKAWNEGASGYSAWLACEGSDFKASVGIVVGIATLRINEPAVKNDTGPPNPP